MKKILIFRTDRIGDFLVISPIISSIFRNIQNCSIDIVCSKMNYEFINSFDCFDNVYLYPADILKKISFFFTLRKYDYIFVTDGKKRSIYFSILKSSKFKYLFTPSISIKKIFNVFFNEVFLIDYKLPKINLIQNFLNKINCDLIDSDINFLLNHENKKYLTYSVPKKDYVILNFDEKWFYKNYINSYSKIEPSKQQFHNFIKNLSKYNNVIIVNGFFKNPILNNFDLNDLSNVIIKNNTNIFELQNLIKNSKSIITCHGAASHIASNYNIKIIDIIDKSEKEFFKSYNHHFVNKTEIFRQNFEILSKEILFLFNKK